METLIEALRMQANVALSKLRATEISKNTSIKGSAREEITREFIRCFLPSTYAIGHGEIFSANNDRSKQIDIIIHDNIFSPVFKTDDGGILVPCEAVYGTVEVKTEVNRKDWNLSVANVESVKRLKRTPSGLTDILPNRELKIKGSSGITITGSEFRKNPYISAVVCLRGLSASQIENDLNERFKCGKEERGLLPDIVACIEEKYLITRYKGIESEGITIGTGTLGAEYDGFHTFSVGSDVLSGLHLGLNVLLSGIRLKNRDLASDWLRELLRVERKTKIDSLISALEQAGVFSENEGWEKIESAIASVGDETLLRELEHLRSK